MHWFLILAAGPIHAVFMVMELFPWPFPLALCKASKELPKLPTGDLFTKEQLELVRTIVHNAGIYNGIVAGGLFWAGFAGDSAADVARVMLVGAVVAGVFGAATFRSWLPAGQAVVGIVGLILGR